MRHWIIRVGNGENFRQSKYPFWGVKRGKNGFMRTMVEKIKPGDIIWFLTSKPYGGKLIGMAEYTGFYDRKEEPLLQIHTKTNEEQNWTGDEPWDIQLHYYNVYNTERQNITGCIQCAAVILDYDTFHEKINGNLDEHYKNFKFYAEPLYPS